MIPAALLDRLAREGTLTLTAKVIPKASRNEVAGVLEDGTLKVKVTAAPEKGKANEAVIEVMAEAFGVPRRQIEIVRGFASHAKQVRISAR